MTNTAKNRHRSRGRTIYRGTPATITTTTTTTTYKPPVQNYTTLAPFTTKSTAPAPFKFTFSPTVRANPALSNIANQISSTPLGPLQQQYQQPNYNNNYDRFRIQSTSSAPIISTQRNNFRANSFNNVISTQSNYNVPQRQIVSAPAPFNTNHNNIKNYERNDKPIANNVGLTNNHIYNNNFFSSKPNTTSLNKQSNGRAFDNHNVINNYQTTSPFSNQRTIANHIPTNNTVLRLTPTIANSYNPQNSAFNTQKPTNGSLYPANQHLVTTLHTPTTVSSQITRNKLGPERPNFNQQDLINQFNSEQRKIVQQKQSPNNNSGNNVQNIQRSDYLTLEQKRLQLHYDINDYLTTDKYMSQYSPTSEKYKSIQPLPNANNLQASQSNQFFTQKYPNATLSTTPKINNQQFEENKQYKTQQDRPIQNVNQQFVFNSQIGVHTTTQSTIPKQPININNFISTSTKKFSTLVPKDNYAPTTFKPSFYFNVAKQINDHLSTPPKLNTATDTLQFSTTSTTSRTNHIDPIFNRNSDHSQFNFRETQANKQQTPFHPLKQVNASNIDENDGQYHPELYERDFARYKIKNRKKQQQSIQQSSKQNFVKSANELGVSNKQQYTNHGSQKTFSTSTEEELLNTAHSQNIAASGNELWARSKSSIQSKQIHAKAPTIPPTITTKEKQSTPREDKDVSYDYAYYDSANDAPHDYSEFDLPDFGKTQQH